MPNIPTCMVFCVFFQDGPVDSSIEIVPKLVKGAQAPGRQPGTARHGVQGQGIGWIGRKLRKATRFWAQNEP